MNVKYSRHTHMRSRSSSVAQHKQMKESGPTSSSKLCAKSTDVGKPLLFVHRDSVTIQVKPSVSESGKIRQHLAQRYEKRRLSQRRITIHPSVARIVDEIPQEEEEDDMQESKADVIDLHEASVPPKRRRKRNTLALVAGRSNQHSLIPNKVNHGILDPFAPSLDLSPDQKHLLFVYCKHLRPLARAVSEDWDWTDSLSEIQSSPMLTCAISAYASAFWTGLKQGARELALPPEPEKNRKHLWPMPLWFRFQTQSLTLLSQALMNRRRGDDHEIYHTILFLFRIAILMGDGITGRMHFRALQHLSNLQQQQMSNLSYDLAVTKINIVTLYLYKDSMVKTKPNNNEGDHFQYTIEPERQKWTDEHEYNKFQAMLFGRFMTWSCHNPSAVVYEEACTAVLKANPEVKKFPGHMFTSLVKHYQIALYLWSYLTNIAYDPSLSKVRLHVEELVQYLRHEHFQRLEQAAPKVIFILLFVGAYASRGYVHRQWFAERLARAQLQVSYMQDVYDALDGFCDPWHCVPVVLEEILIDVRKARDCKALVSKRDLYRSQSDSPRRGSVPWLSSPDLGTPVRNSQDHDDMPAELRS